MLHRKTLIAIAVLLLITLGASALSACGSTDGEEAKDTSASASGSPFKVGFDEGFTGFMATEAVLADHGIQTAIAMRGGELLGRPFEYQKADNGSDPVRAVDLAKQLVEARGIHLMIGPIFSPATAAVTDYLGKGPGIPQISTAGQPSDNLKTANGLAFMPQGFYTHHGYLFGKYCAEVAGFKTANSVNYEDTASRELLAGFEKGFAEGGGEVVYSEFVPADTIDFSSYLSAMPKADCTFFWIHGNGTAPFVKQYHDYGITGKLVVPMASNLNDVTMADMGDLALGIIGCDFYAPESEEALNQEFVAKYREMWDGEFPNHSSYAGWVAVNMFAAAVEKTDGDTTPATLIDALSTISIDTPCGKVTMSPYENAFVGTRDFFILETQKLDDGRVSWVTAHTYEQENLAPLK